MDLKSAKKVLKKVEHDYDLIAKEWDISRGAPRAYQIKTTRGIKKGDKVLDAGCGNGVLYDVLANKSIDYTGMDVSSKLLVLAKKRIKKIKKSEAKIKIIKGDLTKIPLAGNKFDWVLALAVLHHVPSKELQQEAIKEIHRVLKPGGQAIISVWNLYSDYAEKKFGFKEQLEKIPTGWDNKDLLTIWKATPDKIIQRYLYRFDKEELQELLRQGGFKKIKINYLDSSGKVVTDLQKSYNITAVVRK